jgi:hypothetical protein
MVVVLSALIGRHPRFFCILARGSDLDGGL